MYKLLLTYKYLRRRLIPIFALLAVMLCTAMVIIVLSVMGGFLDTLRNAGRTLMGDVSIAYGVEGFPHYERVITELEKLPEVEAATPLIECFGLLKILERGSRPVHIFGLDGRGMNRVTQYEKTLYWTPERFKKYPQVAEHYGAVDAVQASLDMKLPWENVDTKYVPIVLGLEVSPYNFRTGDGTYLHEETVLKRPLTLTILPITAKGGVDTITPETREVAPINEFTSGVYDVDSQQVFIPFDVAQKMMRMEATDTPARDAQGELILNDDGTVKSAGKSPARCSRVYVRGKEGVTVEHLLGLVEEVYSQVASEHRDMPPAYPGSIATWVQRQEGFLRVVENEKRMMAVLFGIISFTAVMIVGVIFYMIVLEKTRDIGTLRALGASQMGVASIFVTFAGVVGALGALIGLTIAWLFVTYINEIHAWLGEQFGIVIWDRSVYFFDRIPSRVDPSEAGVIVLAAVVASLAGAIFPAVKAALVDPVESLRYE